MDSAHPAVELLDDVLGRLAVDPGAAADLRPGEADVLLAQLRADLGLADDFAPRPR